MLSLKHSLLNRVIIGGWIAILFIGQAVLNVEFIPLEWFALAWLLVGILVVKKTDCLLLVLLTCPVFMSEIQRRWAWVQVLLVAVLLMRIVIESRFSLRQWLLLALVGVLALAVSWPADAGTLLAELSGYSRRQLLDQWLHAQAVWAIFPFRETVDRALMAMTCAAMLMSGGYVSSGRLWHGLRWCGILALAAAFCAGLLPWQKAHIFLGTTNSAVYQNYLFHGAGYNLHHFAILLAVGLSWLTVPLKPRGVLAMGMLGLFLPTVFVFQKAYWLSVVASAAIVVAFLGYALSSEERRRRLASRFLGNRRILYAAAGLLVACCSLSLLWFLKGHVADPTSTLRQILKPNFATILPFLKALGGLAVVGVALILGTLLVTRGRPRETASDLSRQRRLRPAFLAVTLIMAMTAMALIGRHPSVASALHRLSGGLEVRYAQIDQSRTAMWKLGLNHSLNHHLLTGEGAGTWARFHRSQPRPYREYYAHMHNTYLDLMFEYGLIPMIILFGLCAVAFFRIAFGYCGVSRLWLLYLVPIAIMALGQHLFYAFTHLCLLLPAFILVPRALTGMFRRAVPGPVAR